MTFKSLFKSFILIYSLPAAWAADTATNASIVMNFLPLVAIIIFFYFIIIRPQQQEQSELKNVQDSVKEKQEVITMSGVLGKILQVKEDWVQLETASNTLFWIKRNQIQKVLPNGTIKHLDKK